MLKSIRIERFKSILDETVELGAFNVFIGANGSGKTNVLEAVAFAAGAVTERLTNEDLGLRGIRVARPGLMGSAFGDAPKGASPVVKLTMHARPEDARAEGGPVALELEASPEEGRSDGWQFVSTSDYATALREVADWLHAQFTPAAATEMIRPPHPLPPGAVTTARAAASRHALREFAIYSAANEALRGVMALSAREPIGLHGENLDVAFATLPEADRERIRVELRAIDWVADVTVDADDAKKFQGHKLGRSSSRLYFTDQFLPSDNNEFAAEVANEGVLHLLFYLTLVLHPFGPTCFGIDNLETALNPGLCRRLAKVLAALAVERSRQILVTTHNPAVLDGLNLHDDQQRLFVVSRDDDGHTRVRRVRVKPDAAPGLKLSELWLRGHLGALPEGF